MLFKSSVIGLFLCVFAFQPVALLAEDGGTSDPNQVIISTDIDSTVDEVWKVMIDFKDYDLWNNWYRVEGEAQEGSTVKAYAKSGDHLDLHITKIAEHELCWTDVSWFTYFGLGGWRCRSVEANPDGKGVKVTNHFEYTGPLGYFLRLGTRRLFLEGMTLENQNLKVFVENKPANVEKSPQ